MIYLIIYAVIAYAITVIVTESYIFSWLRSLLSKIKILGIFITCQVCISVWVGAFLSHFWFSPLQYIQAPMFQFPLLMDSLLTTGLVLFLYYIETFLTSK